MKIEIKLALIGIGVICVLAVIVCSAAATSTLWFLGGQRDYGRGDPPAGQDEKGSYRFDPQTILQAAEPAKSLQPSPDWPARVRIVDRVTWSENDYYRIALASVPPSWHGDLNVEFVNFDLSCRDLNDAPQTMHYTFFNSERNPEGKLVFSELDVSVYATEGQIWWLLKRFFRHPDRGLPPKIDLAHLKVTRADALRIAEANGGNQYRQEAQDDCDIGFTLGYGSWDIAYGGAPGTYRIRVNTETGKTEIIRRR
jgi:hypothetical protein